jgi:WhiB family transcriptional regulator, redox-sensing transcriptional regulator
MTTGTRWVTRLAVAVAQRGTCAGSDTPDAWFPPEPVSATASAREAAQAHARALCVGCPVLGDCLALALIRGEEHGVWGGTTAHERQVLLHGHGHAGAGSVQLTLWPSEDATGDAA